MSRLNATAPKMLTVILSRLTKRHKILLEESWYHEQPEVRLPDRRWYETIPCQDFKPRPEQEGPFICLYDEDPPTLQLYTNRVGNAKNIWRQIRKEPGTRADFHMDGEAVIYFPPALLETVAEMAGAPKKRRLSESQQEAMARGREKAGLTRDSKGRIVHCETPETAPILNDLPRGKGVGRGTG